MYLNFLLPKGEDCEVCCSFTEQMGALPISVGSTYMIPAMEDQSSVMKG